MDWKRCVSIIMLPFPAKWAKSSSPGTKAERQTFLTHISFSAFSHWMRDAHNQWHSWRFVLKSSLTTSFSSVFRPLHGGNGKSRLFSLRICSSFYNLHDVCERPRKGFKKGRGNLSTLLKLSSHSPDSNCIPTSFWSQSVWSALSLTQISVYETPRTSNSQQTELDSAPEKHRVNCSRC